MKDSLSGLAAGLSAAAIWGGMYAVSKVVLEIIPPLALVSLRLILGILTLAIVAATRAKPRVGKKQFWQVFGVGFVGYGVSLSFQFVGTKLSTAANGSLVTSATPAFVLIFAAVLLGERITLRRFLALAIASIGVLAVIDPRTAQLNPDMFWGNLSLIAAALTWALYSVLVRKITRRLDVLTVSLIAFSGGLPVSIPLGIREIAQQGIGEITPGIIAGILFLGIISTALAMYLWNTAFAILDAGVASLTFFAQPVVGTALGIVFLHENIGPLFIPGGILIGIGLVMASLESQFPSKLDKGTTTPYT
jgi:drug/metabolite transporter (DMT)-like permease